MKKIVALVLSLVMVLGLATTAFAAPLQEDFDLYKTSNKTAVADVDSTQLVPNKAVAPKDSNDDGILDTVGQVKFFDVVGESFCLMQVATVAEADWVVKYEDSDTVFGYFVECAAADARYVGTAIPFSNFGEDCGQFDYDVEEDVDYYFAAGIASMNGGFPAVYEAVDVDDGYQYVVKVGDELVYLNATTAEYVDHSPVFTYDKDYKVVAVKCGECGVVANIYANYLAVPKADIKAGNVRGPINGDDYYCWTNAVEAPAADATDKVESAQTFDAGIAMYVGMSVMAAAGSAVVLKKKD